MSAITPLSALSRESGGLAMLAIDQREALRDMLGAARHAKITDQDMTQFKIDVTKVLTPYASAVLVDREFALDEVVKQGAVAPGCALIASADQFFPGNGVPVDRVAIDQQSTPEHARELGAKAMKLLLIWRSDESPEDRRALVDDFVQRCHSQGLLAVLEPVVRAPRTSLDIDDERDILRVAEELGDSGADLYKGQMPLGGRGTDEELYAACSELDSRLATPWVILSTGVKPDLFPNAVRQAVRAGAVGFLAGRAVWSPVLPMTNVPQALRDLAAPRLIRLGEIVDEMIGKR